VDLKSLEGEPDQWPLGADSANLLQPADQPVDHALTPSL